MDRFAEPAVDLRRIYMPGMSDKHKHKAFYFSSRRNKSKWRTSPRRTGGALRGPRVCGTHCRARGKNGRTCTRPVCMDYRFCRDHLVSERHLLIAPSRRLAMMGVSGLGLYAAASNTALRRAGKDNIGGPEPTGQIVFREGDVIDVYGGEVMTKAQFDVRYDTAEHHNETGAYAVADGAGVNYDGLAAATAVSYSNESVDVVDLFRRCRNLKHFGELYAAAVASDPLHNVDVYSPPDAGPVSMHAVRAITHGEELLWNYGALYWTAPGMRQAMGYTR